MSARRLAKSRGTLPTDSDTKTVEISGWDLSQRIRSCNMSLRQPARPGPPSASGPAENGQPEVVTDTPCQAFLCATTSNAARQWRAWLSPTRATVRVAALAGTPNAQTPDAPSGATTAQGALGVICASLGLGITPAAT